MVHKGDKCIECQIEGMVGEDTDVTLFLTFQLALWILTLALSLSTVLLLKFLVVWLCRCVLGEIDHGRVVLSCIALGWSFVKIEDRVRLTKGASEWSWVEKKGRAKAKG